MKTTSSRRSATPRADAGEPSGASAGAPDALVVGALVGPHGLAGELKLLPLTEFPERLPRLKQLRLRFPDGREELRNVRAARFNKELLLLRLEGVENRDQAEALRGAHVVVGLEQAAPLPAGRYYEHEIIGLRVVTPDGEELGRVERIMECGPNDVYVAGPWMIPATHDAVLRLSPEEGIVVVRSREYLEGEEVR